MAKRKRKGKKQKAKRRRPKSKLEDSPPIPDRRAMEGVMQQMLFGLGGRGNTPLDEAQQLMYEAFDAEPPRQVALARKALKISQDCADAYVLLAEHAPTLDEAVNLYQQGVDAGHRAIGPEGFEEYEGHFWGLLETRPYMRARQGLAQCLWEAGRREEAIGHYQEMLRLNPDDNQGIRYLLAAALLDLDRRDDLGRLLALYEEDASAEWTYTTALLAFRQEGDSPRARGLLASANEANEHVPAYLLGNRPMPRELPDYVGFGDENEAVCYASRYLRGWKDTPGAITWLRQMLHVPLPAPPRRRPPSWQRLSPILAELPQSQGEVWQADIRRLPALVDPSGAEVQPWLVYVTSHTDEQILAFDALDTRPSATEVWDHLVRAMLEPKEGDPRRPAEIQVRLKTLWRGWKAKLAQIGVECLLCDELDQIDRLHEQSVTASRPASQPAGASPASAGGLSDLSQFPQQVGEVWQADIRRLAAWVGGEGQPERPWCALVANRTEDLVLSHDLRMEPPTTDWLWESVAQAMARPAVGQPHLPGVIEVASPQQQDSLRPHLESIGVRCVARDQLDQLDFIFDDMARHLAGPSALPALVDVPGVQPEHVGDFFEAAADFYRARPWRDIPGDTPIRVQCDKFQSGLWFGIVMGQMGMTLGLSLHEDEEALQAILVEDASDEENARRTSALSLMYGEPFEIAPADLDAAEKHGWTVAGPEAYPQAIRVNPGQAVRPPLAWELELLTGCLRAIPDFARKGNAGESKTVPVASGELALRLSWA